MLYRVQPGGQFTRADIGPSMIDTLLRHGADLDRLEWHPVDGEHRFSDMVAIALRHGTKTGTGIVFPAHHLSAVERPAMLLRHYADLEQASGHPAIKAADDRREKISPGWIQAGQKNDHAVWVSARESVLDAEQRAQEVMSAPVRDDLAAWWQQLGGATA